MVYFIQIGKSDCSEINLNIYIGYVHEKLTVNPLRIKKINRDIIHLSNFSGFKTFKKWLKYAKLEAKQLGKSTFFITILKAFRDFLLSFLQDFLKERGFLDGIIGLRLALMWAGYNFLKHVYRINSTKKKKKIEKLFLLFYKPLF